MVPVYFYIWSLACPSHQGTYGKWSTFVTDLLNHFSCWSCWTGSSLGFWRFGPPAIEVLVMLDQVVWEWCSVTILFIHYLFNVGAPVSAYLQMKLAADSLRVYVYHLKLLAVVGWWCYSSFIRGAKNGDWEHVILYHDYITLFKQFSWFALPIKLAIIFRKSFLWCADLSNDSVLIFEQLMNKMFLGNNGTENLAEKCCCSKRDL